MANETDNENQDPTQEQVRFSLSISLDRESFFRRACPSCGLEFKTEGSPADFAWALELQLRRVSDEINVEPATVAEEESNVTLCCPYCLYNGEAKEMHTEETVSYLKRFAMREYALPKLHNMLADFADSLERIGGGGGGFISVSVTSNYEPPPLPPRPIYGPDAPDMMIVQLVCCDKKIKIAEAWTHFSVCPFCRTKVTLI